MTIKELHQKILKITSEMKDEMDRHLSTIPNSAYISLYNRVLGYTKQEGCTLAST